MNEHSWDDFKSAQAGKRLPLCAGETASVKIAEQRTYFLDLLDAEFKDAAAFAAARFPDAAERLRRLDYRLRDVAHAIWAVHDARISGSLEELNVAATRLLYRYLSLGKEFPNIGSDMLWMIDGCQPQGEICQLAGHYGCSFTALLFSLAFWHVLTLKAHRPTLIPRSPFPRRFPERNPTEEEEFEGSEDWHRAITHGLLFYSRLDPVTHVRHPDISENDRTSINAAFNSYSDLNYCADNFSDSLPIPVLRRSDAP